MVPLPYTSANTVTCSFLRINEPKFERLPSSGNILVSGLALLTLLGMGALWRGKL